MKRTGYFGFVEGPIWADAPFRNDNVVDEKVVVILCRPLSAMVDVDPRPGPCSLSESMRLTHYLVHTAVAR